MKDKLFEIFSNRPDRFHLLKKGFEQIVFDKADAGQVRIMEIGCGYGDASAYLAQRYDCNVMGIDLSQQKIQLAKERHEKTMKRHTLSFLTADAVQLPVQNASHQCIFMEAAFSPLADKKSAAKEWYRVLEDGGYVLINDFAIKNHDTANTRDAVAHIPCFAGVDTVAQYKEYLKSEGFHSIRLSEEYGELIRLALWVSKSLQIDIQEAGSYISGYYNADNDSACERADSEGDFFQRSRLTYCQLLFQKKIK